jgi:hypothetical protein
MGRPWIKSSQTSDGNSTNSGSGAEFTTYRARQRGRRTNAKQSAKVGSAWRYHAVTGPGICLPGLSFRASTVTSEHRATRTGVVRAMA